MLINVLMASSIQSEKCSSVSSIPDGRLVRCMFSVHPFATHDPLNDATEPKRPTMYFNILSVLHPPVSLPYPHGRV